MCLQRRHADLKGGYGDPFSSLDVTHVQPQASPPGRVPHVRPQRTWAENDGRSPSNALSPPKKKKNTHTTLRDTRYALSSPVCL
jgi:hypothetical protein